MTQELQLKLRQLPDSPGCYIMKSRGEIIYVGKAKNLKNRVRQYFQSTKAHSTKVAAMVDKIDDFDIMLVDREIEALILENNLIKLHKPYYNILLKDDKQYPYLALDLKEDFPRMLYRRRPERGDGLRYFGPYLNTTVMKETLDACRMLFPIRVCTRVLRPGSAGRPCMHHQLGQCVAPCTGNVSREEYHGLIQGVMEFLSGKHDRVLVQLRAQMAEAATSMNYERAAVYRDRIRAVEQVIQKQRAVSVGGGDQDIIVTLPEGTDAVVQLMIVREGKLIGAEHFAMERAAEDEPGEVLTSFMLQRYADQQDIPQDVLLSHEPQDKGALEELLSEVRGARVYLLVPQRGEKKRLIDMALKNAGDEVQKRRTRLERSYSRTTGALLELSKALGISQPPRRIEGFDISNTQGAQSVGSMVVMIDGVAAPKAYRTFRIKTVEGANDFASMHEVITRRFRHAREELEAGMGDGGKFSDLPDLVLIDGGKGQLSEALRAMHEQGFDIPMFSLAERIDEIFLPGSEDSIYLDRHSEALHLVQRLRDEAHRFGITHHRKLRAKKSIASVLDDIPGVGPARKKALLKAFKTIEQLKAATVEELMQAEGIHSALAQVVHDHFHPGEAQNTDKEGMSGMDLSRVDQLIASWQQEIFDKLKSWIAIDSVGTGRTADNAPFGDNVRKALDLFLADAKQMGFDTLDVDGYAGHAQYGQGERTMGILAHLDIVPAGAGWVHDPFGGEIEDGKCFGRGVIDDKGPLLGALYALRAVKESGIELRDGVRIIAGCDEETGMSDMRYYAARHKMPDYGFSPDAEYPLINIEKGGMHLSITAERATSDDSKLTVRALHAGERINVVPGVATALVAGDAGVLLGKLAEICARNEGFKLSVEAQGEGLALITATGVGAHAALPHLGVNAAGMLLVALKELGAAGPVAALGALIGLTYDGAGLGIAIEDQLSGALTCNLGLLRYDETGLAASLDIRYPIAANEDAMCESAAKALAPHGLRLAKGDSRPPHHIPEQSDVVQGLLGVYHELTGLPAYTMAIGGGTYSRMMPNTVAFGINFPGDEDSCHMPDEYVFVDKFMLSVRIMAHAIVRLAGK